MAPSPVIDSSGRASIMAAKKRSFDMVAPASIHPAALPHPWQKAFPVFVFLRVLRGQKRGGACPELGEGRETVFCASPGQIHRAKSLSFGLFYRQAYN